MKGPLLYAILGGILLQSTFAVATPTFEARGVDDDFYDLYYQVKKLINEYNEKIEKGINEIADAVSKFVTYQMKKLDDFIAGEWKTVQEFAEYAEKLGVDVADCIHANNEAINNFPANMYADLGNCSDFHWPALIKADYDAQDIFNDANGELNVLEDRMLHCRSNPFCIARYATDVTAAALKLPTEVTSAGLAATETIYNIDLEISACNSNYADYYTDKLERIVRETTDCIQKKIDEQAISTD